MEDCVTIMVSIIWLIIIPLNMPVSNALDKLGFVVGFSEAVASDLEDTKALLKQLFLEYDKRIRPRVNQSEKVTVNAVFVPNAIVNFDSTGQKIDVIGFFRVSWKDEDLKWNASAYGGTNSIMVPISDIWYPKLTIDRAYDGKGVIGDRINDIVRLTDAGDVDWVPNGIYGFLCDADVTFYPNDIQTCDLQFYATDQPVEKVQLLTSPEVTLDEYTENSEWRLQKVMASVRLKYGTNIVSVRFQIERRPSFTVYTIIIPLFTLSMLSVLTLIVPIESGEKGGLAITVFLAYGFFIAITRDALPHNSVNIPYFVTYICGLLVLSVFTVMYVMLESKLYHAKGTETFNFRYFNLSKWLPKSSKVENGKQTSLQNKTHSLGKTEYNEKKPKRNTPYNNSKQVSEGTRVHISDNVHRPDNGKSKTWADILSITDIILTCLSFLFLCIFSAILWSKVMNRQG